MNYYEVLPLKKTGPEEQAFTYEFEDKIATGNLVTVPLRNRSVKGIVVKEVSKPKFKTRGINKLLTDEPPVTETQLLIAQQISEYYFCSLGEAINAIFPFEFGKRRRTLKEAPNNPKSLESSLKLTPEQASALKKIESSKASSTSLLFGVTGSGKTEVYLQLIEEALKNEGGAIVLVPEIALTPQTLTRFKDRFGEAVAVWHSQLKETEKYHTWERIKSGQTKVAVGARSAIFLPIQNLKYIIIDEEHEGSYKQDQAPRYESQRVAEWLGKATGAKIVLGSATPRVESFYKANEGKYQMLTLNKRVVQDAMPPVKTIDLRQEFQKGNKSIFSESLTESIERALKDKKQVLLFVNRRGAATFVNCRDCGEVSSCPNCEIPLTYHPSEGQTLKCHHCGFKSGVPTVCPKCNSIAIRYFGLGTQKVELEAKKIFPKARVGRMDRDTTATRGSHESYFQDFKAGEFDILIGTQIIAKGWDLPNVAVVGVISADTTLNIPDFRSGERTFALLTQVAGRTGRGFHPGEVFIQTYSPDNYAICAAAKHDYVRFYNQEIEDRKKYNYPPFSSLAKLTFSGPIEEKVQQEVANALEELPKSNQLEIFGPVPAFIPKLGNKYRYHLILKGPEGQIVSAISQIRPKLKQGWIIDINPETLL